MVLSGRRVRYLLLPHPRGVYGEEVKSMAYLLPFLIWADCTSASDVMAGVVADGESLSIGRV